MPRDMPISFRCHRHYAWRHFIRHHFVHYLFFLICRAFAAIDTTTPRCFDIFHTMICRYYAAFMRAPWYWCYDDYWRCLIRATPPLPRYAARCWCLCCLMMLLFTFRLLRLSFHFSCHYLVFSLDAVATLIRAMPPLHFFFLLLLFIIRHDDVFTPFTLRCLFFMLRHSDWCHYAFAILSALSICRYLLPFTIIFIFRRRYYVTLFTPIRLICCPPPVTPRRYSLRAQPHYHAFIFPLLLIHFIFHRHRSITILHLSFRLSFLPTMRAMTMRWYAR